MNATKNSNFTLKILVLFGTENRKQSILNSKSNFKIRNCNHNVATTSKSNCKNKLKIKLQKQIQNRITKTNSKSNFTIRDRNRIEKQIQNHRFASMAYETEHDFWLK
ncbi:unnamed protein product, partial [Rotaria socialis]